MAGFEPAACCSRAELVFISFPEPAPLFRPFATAGQVPSLSCRLYQNAAGHTEGAPPVDVLRRVLQQASVAG
jgi:hypothetical protein